jgi:hypothetical protein
LKINEDYPDDIKTLIEDQERCMKAGNNQDKCYSVSLKTKNAQCCILEYISKQSNSVNCSMIAGSIKEVKEAFTPRIKAIFKELFGFLVYGIPTGRSEDDLINELRFKQNYQCKDGNYELLYGYENFTSEDKTILKSNQHCLRYFYSYVIDPDFLNKMPSKEKCFNADLLENSKDLGIKCGFYEFTIKYMSGKSGEFKSCYVYDTDIIKNKKIDEKSKSNFSMLAMQYAITQGEMMVSYVVVFSDSDGNKYSYDSLTDKVSSSTQCQISKYLLFLLIIFLF